MILIIELIGYTYSKNIKIFIKLSFQDNFINHIKHNIFFYYDLVNELSKKKLWPITKRVVDLVTRHDGSVGYVPPTKYEQVETTIEKNVLNFIIYLLLVM